MASTYSSIEMLRGIRFIPKIIYHIAHLRQRNGKYRIIFDCRRKREEPLFFLYNTINLSSGYNRQIKIHPIQNLRSIDLSGTNQDLLRKLTLKFRINVHFDIAGKEVV